MNDLISRKAAIKAIEDLQDCYNGFSDTYDKACIIGVLEEVPSAQPTQKNESNTLESLDCVSRQAAIAEFSCCELTPDGGIDANYAIDFLEQLPSAQPEYRLDEWCTECKEYDHERHCCPRFNHVIRTTLQEVKEEQVERKKGKWVFDYNNPYRRCKARCSICGKYSGIGGIRSNQLKPFCPNCGAEMTGGEQE